MESASARFAEAAISHAVDFSQYSTGVVRRIVALLNRSDTELSERLLSALARVDPATFTVERLEVLLASVRELNTQAYAAVTGELTASVEATAAYETGYQFQLFSSVIPPQIIARVGIATAEAGRVVAAAMSRPFQGRLLAGWASKIEADRMVRIREAVRQGFVQEESVDQVVRRIRGTKAKGYKDGIIDRSRVDLEGVVRTALAHTAAVARQGMFEANSDVIAAQVWTSTLDGRTTVEWCIPRDGKEYTVEDKPKPIGHKIPWLQGPGRLHFRCRSCSRPRTKTFREMGLDIGEFSASTRASMDGPASGNLDYGAWLEKQSAARQDEVVGPERGRLMRSGVIPFDRLYSERGIFLTLEQLKARDAEAFRRAGVAP